MSFFDTTAKTEAYQKKMRSNDRVLIIRQTDGKKPISSYGVVDHRLFKDENKLHAILGPFDNMWRLKTEKGLLPEPLKCQWTTFTQLHQHCKEYFAKRNLEIKEVVDDYTSSYA